MTTRYRTIVADPPWDHSDGTGVLLTVGVTHLSGNPVTHPEKGRISRPPYGSLPIASIKALPISELAEPDAHLYLWTTNRYLRQIWDVAEAWGFRGVCILTWCKAYSGALGGGAWQANTEFCLFARRGQLATIGQARGRWYQWPRYRGAPNPIVGGKRGTDGHSRKPEGFLDYVEAVSPGPYLELFARRQRLGWDTWGDQALEHVEMGA